MRETLSEACRRLFAVFEFIKFRGFPWKTSGDTSKGRGGVNGGVTPETVRARLKFSLRREDRRIAWVTVAAHHSTHSNVMAKQPELKLKEGDKAPTFSAATNGGGKVSLADFKGQPVILYFYPKDDTPGCTKEACAFRDHFAKFKKKGAVVLGVSTDPVKSHDKFVEKFQLPFTLLADEDKKIVEAYGVWGEKTFMGRKYMGTHRVTFLIAADGRIKKIWPTVKPEEHAEEVLASL